MSWALSDVDSFLTALSFRLRPCHFRFGIRRAIVDRGQVLTIQPLDLSELFVANVEG